MFLQVVRDKLSLQKTLFIVLKNNEDKYVEPFSSALIELALILKLLEMKLNC